jgi:hypothetical protein
MVAWSHESRNKSRRRKSVGKLPIAQRLELFRKGQMTVAEIADFAADAGSENFVTAEPDVNRLLDHEDAIVRYNSLATLGYEWGRTMREDRIREILASDPDRDCRRQAAGALGSLFRAHRDHKVLTLLVASAKNEREEMDVRAFAYTAALEVLGVSRAIQPNPVNLELGENELLALDEYLRSVR